MACTWPAEVCRGLYVGCHVTQEGASLLQELGITHILQVGAELYPSHPELFRYRTLRVYDCEDENLLVHLGPACSFVEGARAEGGAVLVHCLAGVSRSASVVIAYMMWRESLPFEQAFAIVKAARPCINPNRGFVRQLLEYERNGFEVPIANEPCTKSLKEPWVSQPAMSASVCVMADSHSSRA